jgi:hypothetical protein
MEKIQVRFLLLVPPEGDSYVSSSISNWNSTLEIEIKNKGSQQLYMRDRFC